MKLSNEQKIMLIIGAYESEKLQGYLWAKGVINDKERNAIIKMRLLKLKSEVNCGKNY